MDLETLKREHPQTFAAAKAEGTAEELDRVTAHLMLGTRFGDMTTALAAIKSGEGLTLALTERYISTATNKLDIRAMQMDSDAAGAILDGAASVDALADLGDAVADRICGKTGATA